MKITGTLVLGFVLLAIGIVLTALVISAEIGIPMAIAGIALIAGSKSGGAVA